MSGHLVEVVVHTLPDGTELAEAISVDHGPRIELPEGSRVAIEYEAGATGPLVTFTILGGRIRHVDREAAIARPPQ